MRMRHCWLIITLAVSLVMASVAPRAQPRATIPRVGVLEPGFPQMAAEPWTCLNGFRQGLRDLGYVEGHTILLDSRYAEGQAERLPALAAALIQLAPDVLWTHSIEAARTIRQVTTAVPIVVGVTGADLVEEGLVTSLARPNGNLTGLELRDSELLGKRLELLKEAVPTISRVAVLVDPVARYLAHVPGNIEREAHTLGIQLLRVEATAPADFEGAFAAMVQWRADALLVPDHALFAIHKQLLLALALQHRLPTMAGGRPFAEAGSLLAYGAHPRELCQRSAVLVDKILKGAKPAELPVEQPTTFDLVINLKTAQALGLTISPTLLFRATEVIK
jgi:putative tryptophan/tyrosine transport system substrate-binding protein